MNEGYKRCYFIAAVWNQIVCCGKRGILYNELGYDTGKPELTQELIFYGKYLTLMYDCQWSPPAPQNAIQFCGQTHPCAEPTACK